MIAPRPSPLTFSTSELLRAAIKPPTAIRAGPQEPSAPGQPPNPTVRPSRCPVNRLCARFLERHITHLVPLSSLHRRPSSSCVSNMLRPSSLTPLRRPERYVDVRAPPASRAAATLRIRLAAKLHFRLRPIAAVRSDRPIALKRAYNEKRAVPGKVDLTLPSFSTRPSHAYPWPRKPPCMCLTFRVC